VALISSKIAQSRVAKWILGSKPITPETEWIETRQAIIVGECTYLLDKKQVFQCAHCGHYDNDSTATAVIEYYKEQFGISPVEVEVICRIKP
jgi:hypothetical protein